MSLSPSEFLLKELKRRRISAGLTQGALGERIHYSDSHVSAVETGLKPPKPDYLHALDGALETGGLFVSLWEDLVRDGGPPVWLREWIQFEREAVVLRWYEPAYVPGLLQTEAYARATLAMTRLLPEEVDERVAARLSRREILASDLPPEAFVVIDEMVVRRECGSREIMHEQLEYLITRAEQRRIHVNVVPAHLPMYPGFAGAFIMVDLPDGTRYGHVDHQLSAEVIDSAQQIASLAVTWEAVRTIALPAEQSLELLEKVAQEWT